MSVIRNKNAQLVVKITDDPPVNRHKPSVDVLFNSVAKEVGNRAIGAMFTGMGADGSKGMLLMRQAGARCVGQDETTSVVYGMPKAAFEIGAVESQKPLEEMAEQIWSWLATKPAKAQKVMAEASHLKNK